MRFNFKKRTKLNLALSLIAAGGTCLLSWYVADALSGVLGLFWLLPMIVALIARFQNHITESIVLYSIVFTEVFALSFFILTIFTNHFADSD